jgi:hypothetical protein
MTLPRVLLAVLATFAVAVGTTTAVGLARALEEQPVVASSTDAIALVAPRSETRAAAVLAAWDRERAAAWATGDVRRLRALYTAGSVAGHRDREMLRAWLDRGVRVRGLDTQVLEVTEVSRTRGRWVLQVTDRIASGIAAGRALQQPLPRDTASTTTVTLRRVAGRWLVASVRHRASRN